MIATYRLQLQPDFGFDEIRSLLPYLSRLGISHLYLSPITQSRPESTHGYDVIDHNAVRDEIGGREGFERLAAATREAGLEIIIDFVPNHAGVGPRNAYWQDVLAYGPHSPFASYFDIDWNPIKPELHGKILLPFLGRAYGDVLDADEIVLQYDDGFIYAGYFDHGFRLNPSSYTVILDAALKAAERTEPYWDLKDLREAYATLRPNERDKAEALRKRLVHVFDRVDPAPILADHTREQLHALLERQFWRLSFWKTASSEINYRRFFDVNNLVALRMEDDHVFWDAHQLLAELLTVDVVSGLRIDHVDGLFDPHDYLERLRNVGADQIWVEKILAPGETLPESWPVSGTTGYEFMNDAMGVLTRRESHIALEKVYRRVVGSHRSYSDEVYASKKLVIESSLSSELFRLSYELDRISEADYHTRDFTLEAIRQALSEIVAVFDRYRTYLPYERETAHEVVQMAVHRARARNPIAEPTVYQFIADVILEELSRDVGEVVEAWVGRFQQYTAPVAAKGVEDTAFYRYLPLAALNEVGGDPGEFGQSLHAFHSHARFRAHRYPENLLATATHDHKRGEDTRMRMITLAEVPDVWEKTLRELLLIGESHASDVGPSPSDQYLFFQTLVALWEDDRTDGLVDRLSAYMLKATRESKQQTSWTNPDGSYEAALEKYVKGILKDPGLSDVVSEPAGMIARLGFLNSLSQVVLKLTSSGVPDIYQGCELPDLSLVDPDNRRPVDYALRTDYLDGLEMLLEEPTAEGVEALVESADERAKLFFTAALLRLRRREQELFAGDYRPLETADDGHWIAYLRENGNRALLVIVPRFFATWDAKPDVWIELPETVAGRAWCDVLCGETLTWGKEVRPMELPLPWFVGISREAGS